MTDKQIIIDGVDVSGCVRLQDDNISCELGGKCQGWDNCYYKQLKRTESELACKEQECEELKKVNEEKNELLAKLGCPTIATARMKAFTLQQQLDQLKEQLEAYKMEAEEGKEINAELKSENEELKNFHINLVGVKECEIKELAKYKQVIEKVREVCGMTLCGDDTRSLILEICDEVNGEFDQQTIM